MVAPLVGGDPTIDAERLRAGRLEEEVRVQRQTPPEPRQHPAATCPPGHKTATAHCRDDHRRKSPAPTPEIESFDRAGRPRPFTHTLDPHDTLIPPIRTREPSQVSIKNEALRANAAVIDELRERLRDTEARARESEAARLFGVSELSRTEARLDEMESNAEVLRRELSSKDNQLIAESEARAHATELAQQQERLHTEALATAATAEDARAAAQRDAAEAEAARARCAAEAEASAAAAREAREANASALAELSVLRECRETTKSDAEFAALESHCKEMARQLELANEERRRTAAELKARGERIDALADRLERAASEGESASGALRQAAEQQWKSVLDEKLSEDLLSSQAHHLNWLENEMELRESSRSHPHCLATIPHSICHTRHIRHRWRTSPPCRKGLPHGACRAAEAAGGAQRARARAATPPDCRDAPAARVGGPRRSARGRGRGARRCP